MKSSTRRRAGALIVLLALVGTFALGMAGVRLLTMSERYFEETGKRSVSVQVRWPLIVGSIVFAGGLMMVLLRPQIGRD
jgi:hypothetical protein